MQLGNQVARLRDVEGSGGDEENVVGADHAVASADGGAFDDGQNVALHAFARNVGPVTALAAGDLVDLVEEDDAVRFDALNGCARDRVHVDQAAFFFLHKVVEGVGDLLLALLRTVAEDVRQHVAQVRLHVVHVLVGDDANLRHAAFAHVDFDNAVVNLAFAELLAELFARALIAFGVGQSWLALGRGRGCRNCCWRRRQQYVEQALLGILLGLVLDLFEPLFADHVDGDLDQVADHGFDIATDVADLGKLAGLDLEEGRVGQLGQAAGDLGFADARGSDHDDVLGHDVIGDVGRQLLAALAIAQGYGDGALGGLLSNDVFIELGDDLARGEFVEREVLFFGGCGQVNGHVFLCLNLGLCSANGFNPERFRRRSLLCGTVEAVLWV